MVVLPAFLERISWDQIITPVMTRFRKRRLASLVAAYPDLATYDVLDVGGRPGIWNLLKAHYGVEPKSLTLLNVAEDVEAIGSESEGVCSDAHIGDAASVSYQLAIGDGRRLPFADDQFDLAFSNSVIEHVGSFADMKKFAAECDRVAKKIYIQTPNHWFPVEPHLVCAFIHWLPRNIYRKLSFLSLNYALFAWRSASLNRIFYEEFDGIRLLRRSQIADLFPNRNIGGEKVMGLTKSFIVTDPS